jgi:hypothetical protein
MIETTKNRPSSKEKSLAILDSPGHFVIAKRKIGMDWKRTVQKLIPALAWQVPDLTD